MNLNFGHYRLHRMGILIIAILSIGLMASPQSVLAYSCGDPAAFVAHCYGFNQWSGGTIGVYTDILLEQSSETQQGDGFTTHETWLEERYDINDINPANRLCDQLPTRLCWVEGGVVTQPNNMRYYFWAEYYNLNTDPSRPDLTSPKYNFTPSTSLVDRIGNWMSVNIYRSYTNTYRIVIENPWDGSYFVFQDFTYSNTMDLPNLILVGEELTGTNGVSAATHWYYNTDWVQDNFTYHPQTSDGVFGNGPPAPPPNINWWSPPSAGVYPGGILQTWCC